jgi:uncharacterized protein
MAGTSLLVLIDDIAAVLDDVAAMTKVAARKTAGVLGDDLALNAQQVTGVQADRELPVVWAVAKGSMWNKAVLVPAALLISVFAPFAVTPLLMLGGAFLCFEGAEKVIHRLFHREQVLEERAQHRSAIADPAVDPVEVERDKIRGAIRTDFILSAEIIVITLGTLTAASLGMKIAVLCVVAVAMTVGVYGLVAGIVKLDDLGLALQRHSGVRASVGRLILKLAPKLMKFLSVAGTLAMFLVGGSILVHGLPSVHHVIGGIALLSGGVPHIGLILDATLPMILDGLFGFVVGAALAIILIAFNWARQRMTSSPVAK